MQDLRYDRSDSADEVIAANEILVAWSAVKAVFENHILLKDNHRNSKGASQTKGALDTQNFGVDTSNA